MYEDIHQGRDEWDALSYALTLRHRTWKSSDWYLHKQVSKSRQCGYLHTNIIELIHHIFYLFLVVLPSSAASKKTPQKVGYIKSPIKRVTS
jgi:hypothetical protein